MFKGKSSSSFLDALEGGVLHGTIDDTSDVPYFNYPQETLTWTFQERFTDPPPPYKSVVVTPNQPEVEPSWTASGSFARSIDRFPPVPPSTFTVYSEYPGKVNSPNNLQSKHSDSFSPPQAVFSGHRKEFGVSTTPKVAQCVVDIPLWHSEQEDENFLFRYATETSLIPQKYSTNMSTMSYSDISDNLQQVSTLNQNVSHDDSDVNAKVLSEVLFQNRKKNPVLQHTTIHRFDDMENSENIPQIKTNLEQSVEFKPYKTEGVSSTNFVQSKVSQSPNEKSEDIRIGSHAINLSGHCKPGETFLKGYAAGLRSRHQPHVNAEKVLQTRSNISVINICETTYRPSVQPQISYEECNNVTGNMKRASKNRLSRAYKVLIVILQILILLCVIFLLISFTKQVSAPSLFTIIVCILLFMWLLPKIFSNEYEIDSFA